MGTNRIEEAEPLMRRALEIDKAALGEQHPTVAIRFEQFGDPATIHSTGARKPSR